MPKTIKQVEQQRALKAAMEKANLAVKDSRFAKHPVTEYGDLLEPTSGRSFPVPGIGGVYTKNGEKVFVKPMLDEKAALAEMRATQIAREAHGLKAPKQSINVMRDPTDPKGLRKILVLESPFDSALTVQDGKFTTDEYFRQLLASSLRGDKDLGRGNLSGNVLSDVGTAGVFATASGLREYSAMMPSVGNQAMVNLLGIKGSGAKKFFAEATTDIPAGMTAEAYHSRMLSEIETTLPKLKKTIGSFDLNQQEKVIYAKMIKRLEDARKVNWSELHGVHASVVPSKENKLTPAALAKIAAAEELKRRQSGHIVSLSDAGFKSSANGFAIGGMIGNVLKGKAMHRIGAGFGPTGAPKPSMYESAPWGVNSLSIQMAETLFANTGLRKHTQKLFYDKFAAALAKEKPYGYVKDAQGSLKNALEPDVLDSVIRSAASDMIGDRAVLSKLSPIDKDILRKKFLNWESKKDTPLTESLKKVIFGLEKREMGGPVNSGQPYLVGEKGPEIFVPRNSGGIVPNNKYGIGGTVGLLATMIAPQMLASKISNPLAATIAQTVSFVLPQMIMQNMAMKNMAGGGKGIMSRMPSSLTKTIGMTKRLPGGMEGPEQLTRYGSKINGMATSGNKLASVLGKVGLGLTRLNVAATIALTAFVVGKNRLDAYRESMRLNALGYGMTAEAAQKAGLKFTDFNGKLKAVVADAKSVIEHNKMLYESMTTSGTPLKLTIEQYKKLKTEVKSTYKDQLALINKTSAKDQEDLAVRIKEQFIAMGMSAEDATSKIYTMYKLSNKAASASLYTFGNKRFTNRKDPITAAAGAIKTYDQAALTKRDATEQANALNTALMGTDTAISTKYNEMLKARKKDKTKPSFISTGELDQMKLDAESQTLDSINSKLKTQATLTKETINELAKENPEIRKIATTQDTVLSLWQKTRLEARGYTGDLSALNAQQTAAAYKMAEAVAGNVEGQNRVGLLKKQYDALDKLKGLQEKYTKAMKGQSVASQISDRDKLAAINKQIDAINKLADARKKALEDKKNTEDTARAIEAKRLELQNAEATGNTAGAQQARLDLEGLIKGQQYDQQIKAIDAKAKADIAPLTKQAEAINKKQQAMGDAAALAGEKMGDLTKEIEKLETPMNAFNKALTAYEIAIKLHADDLGKWKTTDEAKGMLAAITAAATAAKVDTAGLPVDKATGKIGADAGQALFDKVVPGIEAALQKSGITLNGDLIVNGKKIDMTPAGSGPTKTSLVVGADNNLSLGSVKASGIKKQQGSYIGQEFLDKYGVKYKIINDRYGQIQVAKAATGGQISGPGSGTSDSIPAYLSNGEYVIKADAVNKYGVGTFDALNAQKFHAGGKAGHKHSLMQPGDKWDNRETTQTIGKFLLGNIGPSSLLMNAMPKNIKDKLTSSLWSIFGKSFEEIAAGSPTKGDWANAALSLIPGTGIAKIGMAGKAGLASKEAAQLIKPTQASMRIIKNVHGQALKNATEAGRVLPSVSNGTDLAYASNLLKGGSDHANAVTKFWEDAFNILKAEKNPIVKKLDLKSFMSRLSDNTPGWATRWEDDLISPTEFLQNANIAYLKAHGLHPDQTLALYRASRDVKEPWRNGGYWSISGQMASSYLRNIGASSATSAGGLLKMVMKGKDFISPIGLGGMADEWATVIAPKLAEKATAAGKGLIPGRGPARNFNIRDYYQTARYPKLPDNLMENLNKTFSEHEKLILKNIIKFESQTSRYLDLNKISEAINFNHVDGIQPRLNEVFSVIRKFENLAGHQMIIPKFDDGINNVPADMLAQLHKNEAVIPANMNPFNPNANNATMGGATYNITNNINGYDGDLNQLSNMVTQKTITAITAIDKMNSKMVGTART
jgi:hypothetical protein